MDSKTSSSDLATLTHLSDGEVLAALRDGRLNAIDVLYDRYAKQVYSLAYKILANSEEAEDITQDVFLTLWQRDAYQSTRGSLKAFLTTLTRSRSIDNYAVKAAALGSCNAGSVYLHQSQKSCLL